MAMTWEMNKADQDATLSVESSGQPYGEVIRDYEPKAGVKWRFGRPNYARVNKSYFENRTKKPIAGSPEELVTKVVKNWEVDSHHVADIKDWKTMDVTTFKASVNGGAKVDAQFMADVGPYNLLLQEFAPGYSMAANTFESANKIFSEALTEGFAWECLEVYSGPPKVSFKWRHFGKFTGQFTDTSGTTYKGDGRMIELIGHCVATLNDSVLITELEIYYNPTDQIAPMMQCPIISGPPKAAAAGGCCRPSVAPSVQG
jgi:hypothetical protein